MLRGEYLCRQQTRPNLQRQQEFEHLWQAVSYKIIRTFAAKHICADIGNAGMSWMDLYAIEKHQPPNALQLTLAVSYPLLEHHLHISSQWMLHILCPHKCFQMQSDSHQQSLLTYRTQ